MKKNEKPPISSRLSGAAIPALFHSRIINLPIEFDMEDCKGTPFKSFGVRVYDNSGDTPCRIEGFPVPLDWYNNVLRIAEQALGFCSGAAHFVVSFSLDAPVPDPVKQEDGPQPSR